MTVGCQENSTYQSDTDARLNGPGTDFRSGLFLVALTCLAMCFGFFLLSRFSGGSYLILAEPQDLVSGTITANDFQNTSTPANAMPKEEGESMEYIDRESPIPTFQPHGMATVGPPGNVRVQIAPARHCSKSQFDAIRSPMTLAELLQLLGKPSVGSTSGSFPIAWVCEDGRALSVRPGRSHDPQQLFHGLKLEQQDFGSPGFGQLSMARGLPNGKGRFYLIPKRKAGEVEEAIRNHGPRDTSKPI